MKAAPFRVVPETVPKRPARRANRTQPITREDAPELPEQGKLAGILGAQDTLADVARNESEYVHVSTLIRACPRQVILSNRHGGQEVKRVEAGDRLIWALGRAAESHARRVLAAALPAHAYGIWTCRCGQRSFEGTFKAALEVGGNCSHCDTPLDQYREVLLIDEQRKVLASPDFLLVYGTKFIPVEFKSINKEGFDEQKEKPDAQADHELQVLYYRRILQRGGKDVPYAIIVYVRKDFKWGSNPYLEFRPTENGRTTPSLDNMDIRAEAIRDARGAGPIPEKLGVCSSPITPRAKACGMCAMCFSTNQ